MIQKNQKNKVIIIFYYIILQFILMTFLINLALKSKDKIIQKPLILTDQEKKNINKLDEEAISKALKLLSTESTKSHLNMIVVGHVDAG